MGKVAVEKSWFHHYEPSVKRSLEIPKINLIEMFEKTEGKFPNNPALIFAGKTITYREMNVRIERLAKALLQRGVQKGDRISIFMPNSDNWVISFFAILRAGAVVVQTNPLYVESELKALLQDSGAHRNCNDTSALASHNTNTSGSRSEINRLRLGKQVFRFRGYGFSY